MVTKPKGKSESRSQIVVHNVKTVCQGNIFDGKHMPEGDDMNQSKPLCCFYRTCKLRSIIRIFLPFVLWIGYLSAGALMFTTLEGPGNDERRNRTIQLQRTFPKQMSDLVTFLTSNCSGNATAHVMLVESITRDVVVFLNKAEYAPDSKPWNFFASMIFCLTAVSTIGKCTGSSNGSPFLHTMLHISFLLYQRYDH